MISKHISYKEGTHSITAIRLGIENTPNNEQLNNMELISEKIFEPGEICKRSIDQKRLISLVNTELFPGRDEFDGVLNNLPAVIVYPLENRGLTIVGGWSKRSFTNSDEKWISGWSDKLYVLLSK